jgi:putative transposase
MILITIVKKIRLEKDNYLQIAYPCHITICSINRTPIFELKDFAIHCMDLLEKQCDEYSMDIFAYCFMPDHLHFVSSVRGEKSIIDLVQAFKSISTKDSYQFGYEGKIYQSRFFDHFIRTYEGLQNEIGYILDNPVRKGLVKHYREYPFCKCFVESWST